MNRAAFSSVQSAGTIAVSTDPAELLAYHLRWGRPRCGSPVPSSLGRAAMWPAAPFSPGLGIGPPGTRRPRLRMMIGLWPSPQLGQFWGQCCRARPSGSTLGLWHLASDSPLALRAGEGFSYQSVAVYHRPLQTQTGVHSRSGSVGRLELLITLNAPMSPLCKCHPARCVSLQTASL